MELSLFDHLRALNLPQHDYAIFGSGPLAIREIIPLSNDLDVLCRGKAWEVVCKLGTKEFLPSYNVHVVTLLDGALSFGQQWGIGNFDIDQLIDAAEIIRGLPFVRLEHVVRYKTIRASPKDRSHLAELRASGFATKA